MASSAQGRSSSTSSRGWPAPARPRNSSTQLNRKSRACSGGRSSGGGRSGNSFLSLGVSLASSGAASPGKPRKSSLRRVVRTTVSIISTHGTNGGAPSISGQWPTPAADAAFLGLPDEVPDQAGLAHAGLARDHDQAAVAGDCTVKNCEKPGPRQKADDALPLRRFTGRRDQKEVLDDHRDGESLSRHQ